MIDALEQAATDAGLMIAGTVEDTGTLVLLAASPRFWDILQAAPEAAGPDPVDRYSTRIVTALADRFGATARFPFGGPPYEPFIRWAAASGRAWPSPTGMLVHDRAGLMISYRGALAFADVLPVPAPSGPTPCDTCPDQPCTTACPVGALSGTTPYDVPACHGFLDTPPGRDCLDLGCAARRACPVSAAFGRDPAQSAHRMRAFHHT